MYTIVLSVIGINNHPDINSVLDYLEDHHVIPAYHERLSCFLPFVNEFDARLDYALNRVAKKDYIMTGPAKGTTTWTFVDPVDNYVIVLADRDATCEPDVASYFRSALVESGYDASDIYTCLCEDSDPTDWAKKLSDAIQTSDHLDRLAASYIDQVFSGEAEVGEQNFDFVDTDVSEHITHFTFNAQNFILKVTNGDAGPSFEVKKDGDADFIYLPDHSKLKEVVLNNFFDFTNDIAYVLGPQAKDIPQGEYDGQGHITYTFGFMEYTLKVSVDAETYQWSAEVLTGTGESLGFTDVCDVGYDTIEKQVMAIINNNRSQAGNPGTSEPPAKSTSLSVEERLARLERLHGLN